MFPGSRFAQQCLSRRGYPKTQLFGFDVSHVLYVFDNVVTVYSSIDLNGSVDSLSLGCGSSGTHA